MERAVRYHHPLTLVVVDLDNFGDLNQVQGYEAGDTALCSVAALIKSKMRTVDIIARLSGDEFGVILPETGQVGARMAAERILAGIAGIEMGDQALTACLGVSLLSPETLNTEMFLLQSLAALHEAKSRGADCLAQYGEENMTFAR